MADPANCVDLWGLTASDRAIDYTIRSGETLSQITEDHNYRYATDYTAEEIAALNGITNPDLIYAGDTLTLPVPTKSPYASSGNVGSPATSSSVTSSSQQGSGPILTIGISANLVLGVGGDVSVGLQFDFGNPANSGIVTSAGFAAGASIGVGGFVNITPSAEGENIVTGTTGIKITEWSISGGISSEGEFSGSIGYGAGFGFYNSIEHSSFTSFSDFTETFVESLSTLNLPY